MARSEILTSTLQATLLNALSMFCMFLFAASIFNDLKREPWDFFIKRFRQIIATQLCINALRFKWHRWLESALPTRSNGLHGPTRTRDIKLSTELKEDKLDAFDYEAWTTSTGTAINKSNVFWKWAVHIILGSVGTLVIESLLEDLTSFTVPNLKAVQDVSGITASGDRVTLLTYGE